MIGVSEEPADLCPECGADLTDRNPRAHANAHWPETVQNKDLGPEALRRRKALLKMAEKRGS